MQQKTYKEITPVLYGENLLKVLQYRITEKEYVCFAAHYHERMELLRIHRGTMQLAIGETTFAAQAGELILINPNQSHAGVAVTTDLIYDVIMFDLANLNNNSFAYRKYIEPILEENIQFATSTTHPAVLAAADSLLSAYTNEQAIHPLNTIGMIYSLIGTFYQHIDNAAHSAEPRTGLRAITAYISEHFAEPLSTRTLSATFGYNEAYFSRMFKQSTGESVTQYITALRLNHARKLLKETADSISTIAQKCGFADAFYFSNCFKRTIGQTPREYRNQARERKAEKQGRS